MKNASTLNIIGHTIKPEATKKLKEFYSAKHQVNGSLDLYSACFFLDKKSKKKIESSLFSRLFSKASSKNTKNQNFDFKSKLQAVESNSSNLEIKSKVIQHVPFCTVNSQKMPINSAKISNGSNLEIKSKVIHHVFRACTTSILDFKSKVIHHVFLSVFTGKVKKIKNEKNEKIFSG